MQIPFQLQRLRQKMSQRSALNRNRKLSHNYENQLPPINTPMINNNLEEEYLKNENPPFDNFEEFPDYENVDFKYLSQLIHKANESHEQEIPLEIYKTNYTPKNLRHREFPSNRNPQPLVDSGRRMNQHLTSRRDGRLDDSFYSNLGRQIATLIRNVDADKERQFKIEIEKVQQKSNDQPFLNENAPRIFWERSVRSPLNSIYPFKNKYDYLKNSNELLFKIENKVETFASTVPSLSLQEIENMIKNMEKAQTQLRDHNKIKNVNPSSKTLNINLWPQEIKQSKNSIKSLPRPNVFNINKQKFTNYSKTRPDTINANPNKITLQDILKYPDRINKLKEYPKLKLDSTARNRTVKPYLTMIQKAKLFPFHAPWKHLYNINHTQMHSNARKFFFDENNHYSFQNDVLPIQSSGRKVMNKLAFNTPIIHHRINHVDYVL